MKGLGSRGYFGIGVYRPKTADNIGTLWRSARNFQAAFIFTIGQRYKKQRTDTTKTPIHVPLFEYETWDQFQASLPTGGELVFVEQWKWAKPLHASCHPERAVYVLGAEDDGVPEELMNGHQTVFIDTPMPLNVAVAGSIVLYDRQAKRAK